MQRISIGYNDRNGFSRILLLLLLPFIIVVIAYGSYTLFFIEDPVITGLDAFEFLPVNKTVNIRCENVKSIEISAYQGGSKIDLLVDKPQLGEKTYSLEIKPRDLNLKDGSAIIIAKAQSGIFKKVKLEVRSTIDTLPPTLEVLKSPSVLNEGSAGVAVLRANGADAVYIRLQDQKFEAYKDQSSGSEQKAAAEPERDGISPQKEKGEKYHALFPAPFGIESENVFYAVAEDIAGNRNIKPLSTSIKTKKHKTSSINIDASFVERVVAPLLNEINVADPVSAFQKVNEDLRNRNRTKIVEISGHSSSDILWKGRFLQMKNSKVMATYGDERTYSLDGKRVSKSVHLGYDLASFANAPVEAANSGTVLWAGDLGIYGNTIIIDHGLGLMSIYGHLSMMMVVNGQAVKKGAIIGKTGATGLAGGDHLHFGILVQGFPVSPVYWWDRKWIDIHITNYLTY